MNEQKKTISATRNANKKDTKYIVCESYKGAKSLSAILNDIVHSELNKK